MRLRIRLSLLPALLCLLATSSLFGAVSAGQARDIDIHKPGEEKPKPKPDPTSGDVKEQQAKKEAAKVFRGDASKTREHARPKPTPLGHLGEQTDPSAPVHLKPKYPRDTEIKEPEKKPEAPDGPRDGPQHSASGCDARKTPAEVKQCKEAVALWNKKQQKK